MVPWVVLYSGVSVGEDISTQKEWNHHCTLKQGKVMSPSKAQCGPHFFGSAKVGTTTKAGRDLTNNIWRTLF